MASTMLSLALAWLSGGLLVGAAFLKAIHTRPLRGVLDGLSLGGLPFALQGALLAVAIALQAASGLALVTGLWPAILPAAMLAVVVLMTLAATVAKRFGRLEDCGCYGSFHVMTPAVTRALDALLIGALSGLTWLGSAGGETATAGVFTLIAGMAAGIMAGLSWWRGPMIDIGPLRAGRRWEPAWSGGVLPGDGLVVLASGACSLCRAWVKVLKARVRLGGFYPVTLLTPDAEDATFADLPFPAIPIGSWAFHRLTSAVPKAVRVENGIVVETFSGAMPGDWLVPLREARTSADF